MSEPSIGDILAQLKTLCHQAEEPSRTEQAWRLVASSYGDRDAYAVVDFALEHGLVRTGDESGSRRKKGPSQSVVWRNPVDHLEMIWIPPGPFLVGSKQQRVECPGFSLARHPVTNTQFKRFLDETGYQPPEDHPGKVYYLVHWANGVIPAGFENHPVVQVSFVDALAYCRWAGLALPTEWLWEKAARGPDGRVFPWGDTAPTANRELANIAAPGTSPVGSFPRTRTAYGCEDMVGNVSEWCQWTDGKNPGEVPVEWPSVPQTLSENTVQTAVRGSCFLRINEQTMRTWHRRRLSITRRNQWVGFRPACLLPCIPLG